MTTGVVADIMPRIKPASTETRMSAEQSNRPHWSRRFFAIWTGQAFSIVGSQVAAFAVVWWLTQQTGSAKVLAGGRTRRLLHHL
jgi:hypothetical protein